MPKKVETIHKEMAKEHLNRATLDKSQVIDIIVPTHNHLKLTMGCMDALYSYTKTPFHLVVVDDSTDLTPQYFEQLQKVHDNVTFIHTDEPFKSGNQFFNVALSYCQSDYVATVMNSMEVEPDWEIAALHIMKNDPLVGVVGFKCLFKSNGLIESAGISLVKFLPTDIGRDNASHRFSGVYETDAVQWAFALLRRRAVVGNLGENTFHGFVGFDDIDNSFVLRSKSWKVVQCGLGVGYHSPRATRGRGDLEGYIMNADNGEAFYKRWGLWDMYIKDNPDDAKFKAQAREELEKQGTTVKPLGDVAQIANIYELFGRSPEIQAAQ